MTTVVYHLQKVYAKSGWKVNGTPLFWSFQWKISGSNETSEQLVLFSVFFFGYSKRKFVFPFLQSVRTNAGWDNFVSKTVIEEE